jgi:hypothetical protein
MSILRRATDFILQNRLQAMAVAFIVSYIPLLGSTSILIAGLVTLRKGAIEGALVFCAATIPALLGYYTASTPAQHTNMALMAVGIVILSNSAVWLLAVLLRYYNNWSLLLNFSLLLAFIAVVIVHIFYPDIQHWWGLQLTAYLTQATTTLGKLPEADIKMQLQVINTIKPYATGLIATSLLLNGLLQVGLSRWWQAALFNPGELRKELYFIRLNYTMAGLFILILLASFWHNATVIDLKPVFYGFFGVAGLSLVHYLLASTKYCWFWLTVVYVATSVLLPESVMFIALIALLDVLLNFRQRLNFYLKR